MTLVHMTFYWISLANHLKAVKLLHPLPNFILAENITWTIKEECYILFHNCSLQHWKGILKAFLKIFKAFLCSVFGVRSYPLFIGNTVWLSCRWPISQMWNRDSLFQLWLSASLGMSTLGWLLSPCCLLLFSDHLISLALNWRVIADKRLDH